MIMTFNLLKTWYVCLSQNAELMQTHPATKDSFNKDAVQELLRKKKIRLHLENGGMCPVPSQGMQWGINATFDSHDVGAPSPAGR